MVVLSKRGRRVTRPFRRRAPLYPSRTARSFAMASWAVVSSRLITVVSIVMTISPRRPRAVSAVVVLPVPSWAPAPAPAAKMGSRTPSSVAIAS